MHHIDTHACTYTGEWRHITWVMQPIASSTQGWWTIYRDGQLRNRVLGLFPDNRDFAVAVLGKDAWYVCMCMYVYVCVCMCVCVYVCMCMYVCVDGKLTNRILGFFPDNRDYALAFLGKRLPIYTYT
jgi:hypothetical protein